jgi:hypothetical protein
LHQCFRGRNIADRLATDRCHGIGAIGGISSPAPLNVRNIRCAPADGRAIIRFHGDAGNPGVADDPHTGQ